MFIPDPNFFHPGSASKKLNILAQKIVYMLIGNMIRDVHPGSGSRIQIFHPSRIHGSKRHRIPDPQHWIIYDFPPHAVHRHEGKKSRKKVGNDLCVAKIYLWKRLNSRRFESGFGVDPDLTGSEIRIRSERMNNKQKQQHIHILKRWKNSQEASEEGKILLFLDQKMCLYFGTLNFFKFMQ